MIIINVHSALLIDLYFYIVNKLARITILTKLIVFINKNINLNKY